MIPLNFLISALIGHWVGDFVLQWDRVAKEKSSSNVALTQHVAVYTMTIGIVLALLMPGIVALKLALLNGACHWVTDWFTSRATKRLWAAGEVHYFFVVIGLDQLIHAVTLFALAVYLRAI